MYVETQVLDFAPTGLMKRPFEFTSAVNWLEMTRSFG